MTKPRFTIVVRSLYVKGFTLLSMTSTIRRVHATSSRKPECAASKKQEREREKTEKHTKDLMLNVAARTLCEHECLALTHNRIFELKVLSPDDQHSSRNDMAVFECMSVNVCE